MTNASHHKFSFYLIIFCLLLLVSTKSFGQYTFNRVGLDAGLNSEYIWSISEDNKGNLWLGSINGLVGFDGMQGFEPSMFTDVGVSNLPRSSVNAIFSDNQGYLWVGLQNQIAVLRPEENQFIILDDLHVSKDIVSTSFSYFHELSSRHMLAAAAGSLFLIQTSSLSHTKLIDRSADAAVVGFFQQDDRTGVLFDDWWVYWLSKSGVVSEKQQLTAPTPYQKAYLMAQIDSNRLIIAGTNSGIFSTPINQLVAPRLLAGTEHLDSILTLGKSPDNKLIIGTQLGLFQGELNKNELSLESVPVIDAGIQAQYIYTSYLAKDNTLLLGTDRGLYRGSPRTAVQHINTGLFKDNPDTYAVAQDDLKNIWISSDPLMRFDKDANKLPLPKEILSIPPASHILNAANKLWISHQNGLSTIDPVTLIRQNIKIEFTKLNCKIGDNFSAYQGIQLNDSNQLAFALNGGIVKIDPDNFTIRYFPLGKGCRPYSTLVQDAQGTLFTSRSDEIWQIDNSEKISHTVLPNYSYLFLFNNKLLDEDTILVTTGSGINIWRKHPKTLSPLTIESKNWVSILDSPIFLWAATLEDGIHRINKKTLEVRYYGQADGLLNNKYNINAATILQDGRLAFAGENGLDIIAPNDMPDFESLNLKVSSLKYELDGSRQIVLPLLSKITQQNVTLPANATNIELWLTTSNHQYASDYRFRYKIKNLSQKWQSVPQNSSKFTISSLPVGVYPIDLEVESPSGAKQQLDSHISITITEPNWAWWYNQAFRSITEFVDVWIKLFRTAPLETVLIYLFVDLLVIALIIFGIWYSGKKKQKKLQSIIIQKTEQISNQNSELEHLLNYRQELLANIAHELKTPLTLMLGVLSGKYDDAERKQKLNRLIFRISQLLDNMLDLSNSKQKDNVPNERFCYRTHEFVEFYLTTYKGFVSSERLILTDNQIASIYCEPDTLDKLITNLINNAIKYSPVDTPIYINASIDNNEWIFHIENQGKGIAPEQLQSVFERYVQIGEAKESYGLGLGLPLVKQLAESAGGRIEIKSELEKVTSINVFLPLATKKQLATIETRSISHDELSERYRNWLYAELHQPVQVSEQVQTLTEQENNNERAIIYCVDDNLELLRQLNEQLGSRYELHCFSNPIEALTKAAQTLPDLIVSDLMMPQLSGLNLVNKVRESDMLSHTPVILLTASSSIENKNQALLALADDYITKPYEPNQLALKIDNIIAIRRLIKARFSVDIKTESDGQANGALSILFSECRPEQQQFMQKVIDCFQMHLSEPDFGIKDLSHHLHLSDSQIRRKVKAISGYSPQEVLRIIRLEAAASCIRQGGTLKAVAHDCGFSSQSHMGSAFKAYFGRTPNQYKEENKL